MSYSMCTSYQHYIDFTTFSHHWNKILWRLNTHKIQPFFFKYLTSTQLIYSRLLAWLFPQDIYALIATAEDGEHLVKKERAGTVVTAGCPLPPGLTGNIPVHHKSVGLTWGAYMQHPSHRQAIYTSNDHYQRLIYTIKYCCLFVTDKRL